MFCPLTHGLIHLVAQRLSSFSLRKMFVGIKGSVDIGHDIGLFGKSALLIGIGKAIYGNAAFDGIIKGILRKGADPRIIGPDMRLGIDDDRVIFCDAPFHRLQKVAIRFHIIGERQRAERGRDPAEKRHGNVIWMHDDIIFLGDIQHIGDKGISDILRMIAIEKISVTLAQTEFFASDDRMMKFKLGIAVSDRREDHTIPKEMRQALPQGIVAILIVFVNFFRRNHGDGKFIV